MAKDKKVNQVIGKARKEGYNEGFKIGLEHGKYAAAVFIAEKFEGLENMKGIGPKTMELIVNHFGREYFKAVSSKGVKKE